MMAEKGRVIIDMRVGVFTDDFLSIRTVGNSDWDKLDAQQIYTEYRIQDAECRIQNTEYRIQNTEYICSTRYQYRT